MVQRQNSAPIEAKVENLGKMVIIQVFDRDWPNSDKILPNTQRKFVGKLVSYQCFDGGFAFKIEGIPRQTYLYREQVVEIYLP